MGAKLWLNTLIFKVQPGLSAVLGKSHVSEIANVEPLVSYI